MKSILVVDDEASIRDVLAHFFDAEGYHAKTARDGLDALNALDRAPVDVILTDVRMPRMDGETLIHTLRDRGDTTPVVLMSAMQPVCALPRVICLRKPFDLDVLLQTIERVSGDAAQTQS